MEKFNFGYSTKNIPIPTENQYKLQLMEKIEAVIKRMRWKAIHFENKKEQSEEEIIPNTYGLKTKKCPPPVRDLNNFEKDLFGLVNKLKFRKINCTFQNKLQADIKIMKQSTKTMTPADKTSNMYKLDKEKHDKLLHDAVTKTYKKSTDTFSDSINQQGKEFAEKKNVLNRMDINSKNNCFITLKDHKDNFENNPSTRLINPSKNEIGRISKSIVENLNNKLRKIMNVNQWKNTVSVINWFKNIPNKSKCKFMVFDIKDFYPSITENLLKKSVEFAKQFVEISNDDLKIIYHARKSILYNNEVPWAKKTNKNFDVTMGAYDGAEICELVGLFILKQLTSQYSKSNIGLYRDDGLAIFRNISGPQADKIRKNFHQIFKDYDLAIEIECNLKTVNYLDVTLDLEQGTYRPYRKPNDETLYVNAKSNHPSNIIKQLPISIETRLSQLSSNEQIFEQSAKHYQESLNNCGYNHNLTFNNINSQTNNNNNNRKRNIIWFNPPFSKNVCTNIGKFFLNLIGKHFPKENKYNKIFNKNNLKISYSCMKNIKSIINTHNKSILHKTENITKTCNCIKKDNCPLDNECLQTNIVYEATITSSTPNQEKIYFGLCETTFKLRYANHKKSFANRKYEKNTELANEYWRLKDLNAQPRITWKIKKKCMPYTAGSKNCNLCLSEKLFILEHKDDNLLNKRTELISKCRHVNKHSLMNHKAKK